MEIERNAGHGLDMNALANEPLSGDEVHELLQRLSVPQFAPESPTIAAVSEICGTTPIVVGRMLAEIRQTNLQDLFGKRIDQLDQAVQHQSDQIAELKTKTEEIASRSTQRPSVVINQYGSPDQAMPEQKFFIAKESLPIGQPTLAALLFLVLGVGLVYVFWQVGRSEQMRLINQPPFGGGQRPEPSVTVDGHPAPEWLKRVLEEQGKQGR